MRQRAIARGLRLNEYGLFKSTEETRDPKLRLDCKTEEDIFAALDLAYIPPELREDKGEFDAGEAGIHDQGRAIGRRHDGDDRREESRWDQAGHRLEDRGEAVPGHHADQLEEVGAT
jgi:DNA polymerase (family 10)